MANRFSDIKRGAQLQSALNNYINYIQTKATRPSRIGTQGPRDLSKTVYVMPFTAEAGATGVCMARCSQESYSTLAQYINASTHANVAEALGTKTLINLPKFSAARLVFFRNGTRVVNVETSDVTGLQYLKYSGTRTSCPMGADVDTDDQMEAFLDIKAAVLAAFAGSAVKRVSLSREKVGVEAA
ncbi:hypothetical protein IQ265_12785 [Nodosilinea sp. LEGE 06152]|uniref:hypothetical protein n=1 Tax=Nodosilinea sp. LEGE 06152 TaxID=2777966 RepID=UPI0018819404|nr:hypothetical protein [Nodosilinea sp. LEGE 06152]MBE9157695.1 hypothetical protein [Nodosilinea sp. LEGE 06152]